MTLKTDKRAWAPPNVLVKDLDEEAVLLDVETETYFGLNGTGARMFKALTTAASIEAAIESLLREYDAEPETLRQDVEQLVEDLRSRGLLRVGEE